MYGINITPNVVIEGNKDNILVDTKVYEGFYISYNSRDIRDYGCDTTALVLGQMQKFYILNGDHSEEYSKIIELGFFKCLDYFKEHIAEINKNSEE